jgi:CHAD domain-containing protein
LERPGDETLAEAVHGARKGFKRLRATVRLARAELGDEVYRRENATFRNAGRALSGARDAEVLVETLDGLERRSGARFPQLRESLERDRAAAVARLEEDEAGRGEVLEALGSARARVETWPLAGDDFRVLAPGLRRVYRRGRRALAAARRERSDENLHELRKRVKDLWHATQLLGAARPKRMRPLAKDLHKLSDRLGDDHDLSVLGNDAAVRPRAFPGSAARDDFAKLVARRRAELQEDALARARRLYRRKPRRFVRSVGRRWEQRARAAPA